jgi:hypothetical protein
MKGEPCVWLTRLAWARGKVAVVHHNDKRSQLGHALLSEVVCLPVCGRTSQVAGGTGTRRIHHHSVCHVFGSHT